MKNDFPRAFDTEVPALSGKPTDAWGSDAVAEILRAVEVPYIALNPGASYRGLHDSLVNHLGNARPQMLVSLHEESAVAIAQGLDAVRQDKVCLVDVHVAPGYE